LRQPQPQAEEEAAHCAIEALLMLLTFKRKAATKTTADLSSLIPQMFQTSLPNKYSLLEKT
jgi:hypothetical protein